MEYLKDELLLGRTTAIEENIIKLKRAIVEQITKLFFIFL